MRERNSSSRLIAEKLHMKHVPILVLFHFFASSPLLSQTQYREIPLPFPDSTRFRVQFVDSTHGWITGKTGSILRTTDGGLSWEELRTPYPRPNIEDMRFLDRDYGILWANYPENIYDGRMYQTFNGGTDWVQIPLPYDSVWIFPHFVIGKRRNILYDYSFFPLDRNSIAINGQYWFQQGRASRDFLTRTTDGGQTWIHANRPPAGGNGFFPHDSGRWSFLRGEMRIPFGTPLGSFSTSTDYGETWPPPHQWWVDVPILGGQFWDSKKGVVFGTEGHLSLTKDGGETWIDLRAPPDGHSAVFVKDVTLYMVSWWGYLWLTENWQSGHNSKLIHNNALNVTSAGERVLFLTADGKLFEIVDNTVGIASIPLRESSVEFIVGPNPAVHSVTIASASERTGVLTFRIYNIYGEQVAGSRSLALQPWERSITFSTHALPNGVYFVRASGRTHTAVRKLIVAR